MASSVAVSVTARTRALPVPSPVMCVWESIRPGSTVAVDRSTTSAPAGRVKPASTAVMRSPSMTIETRSRGAADTPSIRRPAWTTTRRRSGGRRAATPGAGRSRPGWRGAGIRAIAAPNETQSTAHDHRRDALRNGRNAKVDGPIVTNAVRRPCPRRYTRTKRTWRTRGISTEKTFSNGRGRKSKSRRSSRWSC